MTTAPVPAPADPPPGRSAGPSLGLDVDPPGRAELHGRVLGLGAVLAGGANVLMQLSWPEVGRGVVESKVDGGNVTKHPLKRTRTTLTYLAVAMYGDEETRRVYRRAVNQAHVHVRSDENSPVRYDAFDPELQLWVASCLYFGARDAMLRLYGTIDPETEAAWWRAGRRFATTLQVPAEQWHADLDAFERYWEAGLARASYDEETRAYLTKVLDATVLPSPLDRLLGPTIRFFNVGFLPGELREKFGVEWTDRQERRHARLLRVLGRVSRVLPPTVRAMPFNLLMVDLAVRRRLGLTLI